MKIFERIFSLTLCGLILYFLIRSIPYFGAILRCYDLRTNGFDEIEFRTRAEGWAELPRCEEQRDNILSLENCINDAEMATRLPVFVYNIIKTVAGSLRPQIRSADFQEREFNQSCERYPQLLFPTPVIPLTVNPDGT